jgi:hypothetical protein
MFEVFLLSRRKAKVELRTTRCQPPANEAVSREAQNVGTPIHKEGGATSKAIGLGVVKLAAFGLLLKAGTS